VPVLNPDSADINIQMKREAEKKKFHRKAKVQDYLMLWQGSQSLQVTQMESHRQNKQFTAVGYISDTEEIVKPYWSNILLDGVGGFELSAKSPVPAALSAKDLRVMTNSSIECLPKQMNQSLSC